MLKDASLTYHDLDTCVQLSAAATSIGGGPSSPSHQQSSLLLSSNELYERQWFAKACQDRLNRARERVLDTTTSATTTTTATSPNMNQQPQQQQQHGDGHSYGLLANAGGPASASNGSLSNGAGGRGSNKCLYNKKEDSHHPSSSSSSSTFHESLLLQHHYTQQEEALDELDAAVTRVGTMASHIHEEIGQQNQVLNTMESDLQQAEDELGIVMNQLSSFLGTKDRFQLCTILILVITTIILFVLVLYT